MTASSFFTPWRLTWYPRIILFAVLAGILIGALTGDGPETLTGRLGGDFPAFYAAGRTVARGEFRSLYDYVHQQDMQKDLFPASNYRQTMPFPYPPFVALAYYPMVLLNYRISFLAHTLLMVLAIGVAAWLLARRVPFLQEYFTLFVVVMLLYYPMLRSAIGGQNTPITFLLFVAVWYAGSSHKEWLAGVFLGLMLFKPQFGIPLIGLHLLAGRWRSVITGSLVGVALYAVTTHLFGPSWVKEWIHYASWVSTIAAAIDGPNSVCWLGFFQSILGVQSRFALLAGWSFAAATILAISLVWLRARNKTDLSVEFSLAAVALVLMQPHAMYYDMALVLFTFAIQMLNDPTKMKVLILMWILAISQVTARLLGFSPLFVLLLCSCCLGIALLREESRSAPYNRQW